MDESVVRGRGCWGGRMRSAGGDGDREKRARFVDRTPARGWASSRAGGRRWVGRCERGWASLISGAVKGDETVRVEKKVDRYIGIYLTRQPPLLAC